jgi:hypothetical protein
MPPPHWNFSGPPPHWVCVGKAVRAECQATGASLIFDIEEPLEEYEARGLSSKCVQPDKLWGSLHRLTPKAGGGSSFEGKEPRKTEKITINNAVLLIPQDTYSSRLGLEDSH